jgi:hypothetical protein
MKPSRMVTLIAPLALAVSAALPASAGAACARVPFKDLVSGAKVIATVEFLAGDNAYGELRTPAAADVKVYDQGSGPQQLKVSTALGAVAFGSEGIRPKAGELWRVYGTVSPNGSLGTSVCAGSILMPAQTASASLVAGGKTKALVPASIAGKPHSGKLPVVKLPKSGALKLRAKSPAGDAAAAQAATARLIQPGRAAQTLNVKWSGRSSAISGTLPKLKLGKKGGTLVVVTREASFAIALKKRA